MCIRDSLQPAAPVGSLVRFVLPVLGTEQVDGVKNDLAVLYICLLYTSHMALHKCLQQAVKERLLVYNPCDAVTLPSGEKPEISVFTNDQQRALVQASYRHRYGVFIRLDLCTGLRMGELLALKWEDIDFSTAQLHVCLLYTSLCGSPY